jgi:myo-inositol-1(or 4)-monophosphatase
MNQESLSELLEVAKSSALLGGKILFEGFQKAKTITYKSGVHNIVTEYDIASEKAIIGFIKERFPEHEFLAEESGGDDLEASIDAVRWIIDPLDGTVNFAHGIPIFSVSIGAEYRGEIVAGAIYQPILGELFYASKGNGAFMNDEIISVSDCGELNKSILVTGFPYNVHINPDHTMTHFNELVNRGIPIRRLGSAAVDMAYVANGRFDGFWEVGLSPWDVAAGCIIIQEAGGSVTNYKGEPFSLADNTLLCTNGMIHQEFVEFLSFSIE